MEKVKQILTNKWFKFAVSFAGIIFTVVVAYFDYIVFFYDIEYTDKMSFSIAAPLFCLIFALFSVYTRRSPVTVVLAMVNALLFLPLMLLDWGNWPLLIPAFAVTLFGFFNCHMNETIKTIFGTFFLLLYILGGIAFYLLTTVFSVTTVNTLVDQGVSPSGAFRYYVIDAKNKSTGKKYVYVQPNSLDIDKGFIELRTTIRKLVSQDANPVEFNCRWEGPIMYINDEEYFNEEHYIDFDGHDARYDIADRGWIYTSFDLDYPIMTTVNTYKERIGNYLKNKGKSSGSSEDNSTDSETSENEEKSEESGSDENDDSSSAGSPDDNTAEKGSDEE